MPQRGYADGPFGQIHYQDTGSGQPLVLCHQAPITSRQYDLVYPLLAEAGFRAVGIDSPGFGMSDAPPKVPTIADYASAVLPVLDHLGIDRADICGHHTGALIATEVALGAPGRIRKVILNGPTPFTEEEREEWLAFVEEKEKGFTHREDGSHLQELYAGRWEWAEPGTDPALVTRYVVEQLMGYGPFWYGHNAAFHYDHAARMKLLEHPTLILTNTGDVIYEHAKRAHALRPDFEFAEIEGGSIDITDQRPAEWVQAVANFLR